MSQIIIEAQQAGVLSAEEASKLLEILSDSDLIADSIEQSALQRGERENMKDDTSNPCPAGQTPIKIGTLTACVTSISEKDREVTICLPELPCITIKLVCKTTPAGRRSCRTLQIKVDSVFVADRNCKISPTADGCAQLFCDPKISWTDNNGRCTIETFCFQENATPQTPEFCFQRSCRGDDGDKLDQICMPYQSIPGWKDLFPLVPNFPTPVPTAEPTPTPTPTRTPTPASVDSSPCPDLPYSCRRGEEK
jgi:hypothetical protein